MLDPSIGRWMGVDPRSEHDMAGTPYNSMYNDPLSYTDPEGDCPFCWILPFLGNILPTATVTASAVTASAVTAVAATAAVAAVSIPTLSHVATPISSTLPSVQQIYSGSNYGYVDQAYDPSSNTLTKFGEIPAQDGYGTLYRTNTGYWKSSDAFLIKGESIDWVNSYATLAGLGGIQGMVGTGLGFAATAVGTTAFFASLRLASGTLAVTKATGQAHHLLSTKITRVLNSHPTLKGAFDYSRTNSKYIYNALDDAAHKGYQTWHRQYDARVVEWLQTNVRATPGQFDKFLHNLHQQPWLKSKIPNVNLLK
jgi:hypothetical protein